MDRNSKPYIFFYAPTGKFVKGYKSGGAEAGCRKTIEILSGAGYNIIPLEKPSKRSNSKINLLTQLLKQLKLLLQFVISSFWKRKAILHIAGFYREQVYFEWLLVMSARLFRVKCIYEIRNGGMIEEYESGNLFYKKFMLSIFKHSSLILCQGTNYVDFLKNTFNIESICYPNYIMDRYVTGNNLERQNEQSAKLIYFGRVVPDKNISFIIEICKHLKDSNFKFHFDIIGSYEETYYELLVNKIREYNLGQYVSIHGRMEFDKIYCYLKSAHYFIFPSKEKREGHSNSLTESMGCGVVPIASEAGFNAYIVGDSNLIIRRFDSLEYSSKILEIWKDNTWSNYSKLVHRKVVNNYTESIVKKSLLKAYRSFTN